MACKAIPKDGVIEVQMLQHIGLSFVKDQETGMFEDQRIVPEANIGEYVCCYRFVME